MALTDKLAAIADAIRAKTGGTSRLTLAQMPSEIAAIETGPANCLRATVRNEAAAGAIHATNHVVLLPANAELAAARSLGTLVLTAASDTAEVGSIVSTIACGAGARLPYWGAENAGNDIRQGIYRINESGIKTCAGILYAPDDASSPNVGNGRLVVMEDGELRWYNNASSFSIRPSNVEVMAWW